MNRKKMYAEGYINQCFSNSNDLPVQLLSVNYDILSIFLVNDYFLYDKCWMWDGLFFFYAAIVYKKAQL